MDTDLDLCYLAGFFDGEGCVVLTRRMNRKGKWARSFSLVAQVTQKGRYFVVLERFQRRWGGYFKYDRRSDVVQWQCVTAAAARALTDMLPYLLVKREKAVIVLEVQARKTQRKGRHLSAEEVSYEETAAAAIRALTIRDSKVPVNPLGR